MSITYCNPFEIEGAGAQYQRIVAIFAICKRHNLEYIHSSAKIAHNYDNAGDWDDKWDKFFNMKSLEYDCDAGKYEEVFIRDVDMYHILQLQKPYLMRCMIPFRIVDNNPTEYYGLVQEGIRKAYDCSPVKKESYLFDKKKISIAVHIRVFNQNDLHAYEKDYNTSTGRHFITDKMYEDIILRLKEENGDADVHIFSQNSFDKKYASLRNIEGVNIHLDEVDAFDTFHHLCSADILVLSSSSFSYLAGIYNKNKVVYIPFWHPPLEKWFVYDECAKKIS